MTEQKSEYNAARLTWFLIGMIVGTLLTHASWVIGLARLAAKGLL